MTDLITPDLVRLDAALGDTKQAVIRSLADIVADAGRSHDAEQLAADAFAREDTSATGLPGGIAIPHCRTTGVEDSTLAFARLDPAVHFGAADGPADLVFLIATPTRDDADHLQLLTKLARALVKPAFADTLRASRSPIDLVRHVNRELRIAH
jgi:PTS system fructose-specific IIC component